MSRRSITFASAVQAILPAIFLTMTVGAARQTGTAATAPAGSIHKIKHIVVTMQQDRSFATDLWDVSGGGRYPPDHWRAVAGGNDGHTTRVASDAPTGILMRL